MFAHSGQIDHILMFTVPFVWNLTYFSIIVQLVQIMWLFSQMVKNFNICKHNVYCSFCMELDLLHYIWCEILLEH